MYAEEFVRAYERQIAEYKRLGGGDTLMETVVLNEADLNIDAATEEDDDSLNEMLDDDTSVDETIDDDTSVDETIDASVDGDIDSAIDMLDDEDDFLDQISLDDLPDEEPADQAKG